MQEFRSGKFEVREDAEKGKKIIRGYPILFNTPTKVFNCWGDEFEETILPTALDTTDLSDVFLFLSHDASKILARSGINMRLEKDETGLFFEAEIPNTTLANDVYTLVAAGILDGMSFGFDCNDNVDQVKKTRLITRIEKLYEITLTTFPAYKEASAIAQSREEQKQAAREKREANEAAKKAADDAAARKRIDDKIKILEEI